MLFASIGRPNSVPLLPSSVLFLKLTPQPQNQATSGLDPASCRLGGRDYDYCNRGSTRIVGPYCSRPARSTISMRKESFLEKSPRKFLEKSHSVL